MAITDGYTTLATLKAELGVTTVDDDTRLERVVETVSRSIDEYTGFPERQFFQSAAGTVRYYTAELPLVLYVGDFDTITAVEVDRSGDGTYETSLDITAGTGVVHRAPYNANDQGKPYTRLEVSSNAATTFPVGVRRGVKVTGTWGWPAIPKQVEEACLIQSARVFRRAEVPFGIVALSDVDARAVRLQAQLDADVQVLLRPLIRQPIGVS